MKKTIITEKFDENGKLIERITESIEEENECTFVPYVPYTPPTIPQSPWYVNPIITSGDTSTFIQALKDCAMTNRSVRA